MVEAALGRLQDRLGGHVFEGDALSPDGVLTHGKFVALGPTMFYASDDGTAVGLAETQANAADPVVVALPSGFEDGIIQAASSGTGSLPLDATLGKAIKKVRAEKTLGEYVEDGGFVGNIILALGTAALALTLFKIWEILGFRTGTPEDVDKILNELAEGDRAGAAERAERVPGAAGEMLLTGVEHAAQQRGVLEELLFEKILKVRPRLERFLPFLAITAGASPLLGLLGTVSGMIETFQLITIFGTGDARNLSSGISEALVTTAHGPDRCHPDADPARPPVAHGQAQAHQPRAGLGGLRLGRGCDPRRAPGGGAARMTDVTAHFDAVWRIWRSGGVVMLPLFLLAVLLYAQAFQLLLYVRRVGLEGATQAQWWDWVRHPERAEGRVAEIVRYTQTDVTSLDEVRDRFEEIRLALLALIERRAKFVATLVSAAPLMGLLGTVMGMLRTFMGIANSAGEETAGVIAGGISEALVTTQTGLTIALPGLFVVMIIQRQRHGIEAQLARLESLTLSNMLFEAR